MDSAYEYLGNANNANGNTSAQQCFLCMGPACPAGRCALPVQLNAILRGWNGAPLALTASLWARDAFNGTTDVLGDYGEYWQPWADVVDADGLPKALAYRGQIELDVNPLTDVFV